MKKVLLITESPYPGNTAMSVRYHALSKLLMSCGCEVLVLTRGISNGKKIMANDGVSYLSVSGKANTKIHRAFDYLISIPRYTKKLLKSKDFDSVLLICANDRVLNIIKKLGIKQNLTLMYDSDEWYSPCEFENGENNSQYIQKHRWVTQDINEQFRVISISSFLDNHFSSRGIKSVRVPVIMDTKSIHCNKKLHSDKLVIAYAGTPGKKDYLKEVVDGCAMLDEKELSGLQLRLIGIKKEQLTSACGVSKEAVQKMDESLICYGRQPHSFVEQTLEEANFTVLLRPAEERYAKAGFPTKVVESLVHSTPVICNLTSDLGMYIEDMKNGIVVENCTAEALSKAILKALRTDNDLREAMCAFARKTAEDNFDYRLYVDSVKEFLS